MTEPGRSATLLVTRTYRDIDEQAALDGLVKDLAARLDEPVIPFGIDQEIQPLTQVLGDLLRLGTGRLITLPLFLTAADYEKSRVGEQVAYANRRWPFVEHHVAAPLDWQDWSALVAAQIVALGQTDPRRSAVILAGHGGSADANSDVAKLARLVYEQQEFCWVQAAFIDARGAGIGELIASLRARGADQVFILPQMLFPGRAHQRLLKLADAATQPQETGYQARTAPCLCSLEALTELLLAKREAALANRSLLQPTLEEIEAEVRAVQSGQQAQAAGPPQSMQFARMKARIEAILPHRYQGSLEQVSAAPMTAADLVFNPEGAVLWDQVFGLDDPNNPYCELALAGGPAHRGELLEAVSREACLAEPGKYAAALEECSRGIGMITGLQTVESDIPGWLGVECDSEEMAIWLMRAIIVENVMVRRQARVIYLPVGPDYSLQDQIKSIVTVTAKTWHYWIEHITSQQTQAASRPAGYNWERVKRPSE